ncbi:MAG: cysteine synthase family protein [Myxococcota bacterium]
MTILDHIGRTPLVRLQHLARGLPVEVWAKCEHLNPTGSVKDRIALAIVDAAEADGRLRRGDTLVEATAGNTGLGLGLVAAVRGYRLVCVLPEKMSVDKRRALAAVGAEVVVTPNAPLDAPDNFQRVAERLAAERGWFLVDQFRHPANPAVHERTTGPEIVAALPHLGAFVAGVGTGGTITGVARCLAREAPRARVILADPVGSGLAELVRTGALGPDAAYAVEGIGSSRAPDVFDPACVHDAESVSDAESFGVARRLQAEEGLLVGGSAGTAVAAALRVAARSRPADGPVVALLADGWDRYRSTPWMA